MSTATASKSYTKRGQMRNPVKNPGAPDRKAHSKLSARIGDYARMLGAASNKDYSGYHKPGSMQR